MCGITGIIHFDRSEVSKEKMERFNDSLAHRGPDGSGYSFHRNNSVALAHRRLSILDLSDAGKQPMHSSDKRFTLTFNGEVFNFLSIRAELEQLGKTFASESDTEVILAAYQMWGMDCFDKFNGMWAMAIYDAERDELLLSRDRFGIKPLYYIQDEAIFAFASETQSFKSLDGYVRRIDKVLYEIAQSDVFALEGQGYTVFEGIRQLLPGHAIRIKNGDQVEQKRWWSILDHNNEPIPDSIEEQAAALYDLFYDACKLRLISDVNVGTALSGGLDSSAVLSTVNTIFDKKDTSRTTQQEQRAFSLIFPGLDQDEQVYAQKAFDYTNGGTLTFVEAPSEDLDQKIERDSKIADFVGNWPITSASLVYEGMRKSGVKVSLDGHGVDEMLFGYKDTISQLYYQALFDPSKTTNTFEEVLLGFSPTESQTRLIRQFDDQRQIKQKRESKFLFQTKNWIKTLTGKSKENMPSVHLPSLSDKPYDFAHIPLEERVLYEEFFVKKLPTLLRNFDRASMIHGVEVRMPFMDWRLVSYVFSLPTSSKLNHGFTKLVLREAMKGKMSEEIRTRRTKVGITSPIEHWMKGPIKEWVHNKVQNPELLKELKALDSRDSKRSKSAYLRAWQDINFQFLSELN